MHAPCRGDTVEPVPQSQAAYRWFKAYELSAQIVALIHLMHVRVLAQQLSLNSCAGLARPYLRRHSSRVLVWGPLLGLVGQRGVGRPSPLNCVADTMLTVSSR
jgi:hypothetical protein